MNQRFAYTLKEACEALRCGRTKLYELIRAGDLKAVALGGKTLIPCDALERLIAELPLIAIQKGLNRRERSALDSKGRPLIPSDPLGASKGTR